MSDDRVIVDITTRTFSEVGDGPLRNVRGLRYSDPLDRVGTFSFTVPAGDPWFDSASIIVRTHLARVYIDGTLIYTGIIETTRTAISQDGTSTMTVTGRGLAAELAEVTIGFLDLSSGSSGVQNGPALVLAAANDKLAPDWSLATTSATSNLTGTLTTVPQIYVKFAGESALLALTKIASHQFRHFVTELNERSLLWCGNAFHASGIVASQGGHDPVGFEANDNECIIQSFSEEIGGQEIVTRVYPYGGGTGAARLTIAPYNSAPGLGAYTIQRAQNYVEYNPNNFPRVERTVEFKDITPISNTDADVRAAANQLVYAAAAYISDRTFAPKVYRMRVTRVPDPRALRPGLSIDVAYQDDVHNIDASLYIHDVSTAMADDGALTHDLTVSERPRRPQSEAEWQASIMQQGQVFQSHQQMGPSVNTISYREHLDDDFDANLRFWLGDEIAQIQQVLLRYRVDPLRSTVKSSGGTSTSTGASSTSSSGSSSSSTTAGGGAATPTSGTGNHVHPISIPAGTIVGNIGVDASNNIVNGASVVGVTDTDVESGGHTHSVSVPSHTHGMAHTHNIDHTHDVTATINTAYGVFEESGANTYAIGELAVAINGTTMPGGQRIDLGGGWYAFDLTEEVKNSGTFRPNQEANTVAVSQAPDAGKSAQITAQIQIRAIIQSVSYS